MSEETKESLRTTAEKYGWIADAAIAVGILMLIGFSKVTPSEGLPWLAALMGVRMKSSKGGGLAAVLGLGLTK